MRYLFLLRGDERAERALTAADRQASMGAHGTFLAAQAAAGRSVSGEARGPSGEAVIVRGRRPSVTDGPFLETKEQLGGFSLIDCADRDDAIAVGADVPDSPGLVVEIRTIPD